MSRPAYCAEIPLLISDRVGLFRLQVELQERLFEQHSARVAERPLPRAGEDVHAEVETDDGKKELRIVGGHAVMREIRFRHFVIGKSSGIRQEAWLTYLSKSIVGNTLTGNSSPERGRSAAQGSAEAAARRSTSKPAAIQASSPPCSGRTRV